MNTIDFSILDFGLRDSTMGALRIQLDLFKYAQHADELGFKRFWLAEHYYTNRRLAWTNPEPLITLIAAHTDRIKVGAAGILLGVHQPFHVAAYFKLLNNLFPDRIDLGVANGAVQPIVGTSTVGEGDFKKIRKTFDDKLSELLYYLRHEEELAEGEEGVVLPPYRGLIPDVWCLGSSNRGLERSLKKNVHFARTIFHTGADLNPDKETLLNYRAQYQQQHGTPLKVTLAISGCCLPTDADVQRTVEHRTLNSDLHVIGTPNEFYDKIMQYQESFGVNEFVFKDIARTTQDRLQTLEIISDLFRLADTSCETVVQNVA